MPPSPQKNPVSAPVWRRLAALTYDTFILLALSFAYGALVTGASAALGGEARDDYTPMFNNIAFFLGWMLTLVSFYLWFWWRGGQTLGMKTWRIQLIHNSQQTGGVAFKWLVVRVIAGIPCFCLFGVGYWYGLTRKDGDCLHDIISKTRVVTLAK